MDKHKVEIQSLMYRMNKIEEKCQEMRNLVSGTGESYEDLLKTDSGRFSVKKINEMCEALVDCLNEYRVYRESVKGGHLAAMKDENLLKEDREFYEAYFYLMLGFATYDNSSFVIRFFRPGTWDAFLNRVDEEIEYQSVPEFDSEILLYELPGRPLRWHPAGLLTDLCNAYSYITGENFSSILSEEARKAACRFMTKQEISYLKNPEKKLKEEQKEREETDKAFEELLSDPEFLKEEFENIPDICEDNPLADCDLAEQYNASITSWKKYFSDKERFKRSCLIVKEGILERYKKGFRFREEIKMAVQLYLWENGISEISDEDMFMVVYAYLDKALKISEIKINEIKNK